LSGTGAGVFTDLGFTFTAVDGGKKCTDTKDLEVSIEVLSNEIVATGEEVSHKSSFRLGELLSIERCFLFILHSLFLDGVHFRFSCQWSTINLG